MLSFSFSARNWAFSAPRFLVVASLCSVNSVRSLVPRLCDDARTHLGIPFQWLEEHFLPQYRLLQVLRLRHVACRIQTPPAPVAVAIAVLMSGASSGHFVPNCSTAPVLLVDYRRIIELRGHKGLISEFYQATTLPPRLGMYFSEVVGRISLDFFYSTPFVVATCNQAPSK
jgi:hypothetical protein